MNTWLYFSIYRLADLEGYQIVNRMAESNRFDGYFPVYIGIYYYLVVQYNCFLWDSLEILGLDMDYYSFKIYAEENYIIS